MVAVPVVAAERAEGRPADEGGGETLEVGLEGKGGDEGEGVSKGVSESSPSGVEAVESAMADDGEGCVLGRGRGLRNGGVEDRAEGGTEQRRRRNTMYRSARLGNSRRRS
jgi:hypothetical protein